MNDINLLKPGVDLAAYCNNLEEENKRLQAVLEYIYNYSSFILIFIFIFIIFILFLLLLYKIGLVNI